MENSKKGVSELSQEATSLTIEYYNTLEENVSDKEKLSLANKVIETLCELCSLQHEYLTEVNRINDEAYLLRLTPTPKQ